MLRRFQSQKNSSMTIVVAFLINPRALQIAIIKREQNSTTPPVALVIRQFRKRKREVDLCLYQRCVVVLAALQEGPRTLRAGEKTN